MVSQSFDSRDRFSVSRTLLSTALWGNKSDVKTALTEGTDVFFIIASTLTEFSLLNIERLGL